MPPMSSSTVTRSRASATPGGRCAGAVTSPPPRRGPSPRRTPPAAHRGTRPAARGCSSAQLVAGLVDRGAHGLAVDPAVGGDGRPPAVEVDLDRAHAGHGAELVGHRLDAVAAGHALHL